jgi:hypothetical protein
MTVVIAVGRAARATTKRTTSSQNVIVAGRHVAAAASKTRKVDAGTTACEGKSAPGAGITRWASPSARSAQIRGAVSVHQDSLIHKACRYVRWACMWVMWCYCDCSWMRSTVVIQSRSSKGAAEIDNASCAHRSGDSRL